MMDIKATLFQLSNAAGTAGQTSDALPLLHTLLEPYMTTKTDTLGNVVGTQDGVGTHILLEAHMDVIGMVVTAVEENGFLRVAPCGGVDVRCLAAHDVTVHGKEKLFGVVTSVPPHLLQEESDKAADFDTLLVDTGLDGDRAQSLVSVGDRVTLRSLCWTMHGGELVSGAYTDDMAGVCVILRCLEILQTQNHRHKLTVLFSQMEETGGSGALTGGFACDAPVSLSVDVSFAKTADTPKTVTATLGGGVMIGIAPILDYAMSRTLQSLAEQKQIPYQMEIMADATGTDADALAVNRGGRRAALLSVPQKNMHTPVEMVSLADIEAAAQLMAAYIMQDGGEAV